MSIQRGGPATPYYTPSKKAVSQSPQSVSTRSPRTPNNLWTRARTTLKGQFVVLASAFLLLGVALALFTSLSFRRSAEDLDTIAKGSIPSVNAAQSMGQYLADIDAKAADYLATAGLNDPASCSLPGSSAPAQQLRVHDCDERTIDSEIILFNGELFKAAHNVTYPGERTAIERITAGFQEYVADITLMRNEYEQAQKKTDPNDPHLKNAYQFYLAANKVLREHITRSPLLDANGVPLFNETVVPACQLSNQAALAGNQWPLRGIETNIDCLSAINYQHLQNALSDTDNFLTGTTIITGILCFVFCALLLFTVGLMIARTHRLLNPGLLPASLAGVILSIIIMSLFSGLVGDMSSANAARHGAFAQLVKDDYKSVYAAVQLKRYGTNANADESRWLIALEFNDSANVSFWFIDWQSNKQKVENALRDAVNNRTWPEEDQPLRDMQDNWKAYTDLDSQLRAMANNSKDTNHILNAERLSTGQSNSRFGTFTSAVDHLGQANQQHFDSTYQSTQVSLMLYIILCAILFPIIGLLAIWGTVLRFKDF